MCNATRKWRTDMKDGIRGQYVVYETPAVMPNSSRSYYRLRHTHMSTKTTLQQYALPVQARKGL